MEIIQKILCCESAHALNLYHDIQRVVHVTKNLMYTNAIVKRMKKDMRNLSRGIHLFHRVGVMGRQCIKIFRWNRHNVLAVPYEQ